MSWAPNLSPYVVLWHGEWRAVTWLGQGAREVDDPSDAAAAVLYVGLDEWVAISVVPSDVQRRQERGGTFLNIDDDECLTTRWPPILS